MRVLVVDDQSGSRKRLGALLDRPGIEKIESNDVDGVLAWTREVDLAIVRATFDEGMEAPEGGVTLKHLRRMLDTFEAPFIVLTDSTAGSLSALQLSQAHLLFKFAVPLDVERLERTVNTLLRSQRRVDGRISDESLDNALVDVVRNEESGVLLVNRGVETRRVVVDKGKIVFCGIHHAHEDEDLFEIFDCGDQPSARAAWDAILELYMWGEGEWRWYGARIGTDAPCALPIALGPLRKEGKRRQQEWLNVRHDLPPDATTLSLRRDRFPSGFPSGDRDVMLVERIGAGATVGQIRAAWGRQDFSVCARLIDLLRLGFVERGDTPLTRQKVEELGLAPYRSVRLARKVEELLRGKISSAEGFLVSRLSNGELLVEDVLSMCPVPVDDVMRALVGMIGRGLVIVRDLRMGRDVEMSVSQQS